MKTFALPMGMTLLLAAAAACGGNGQAGPTPDQPPASPSPAAGGGEAIDIFDFGYRPATAEVTAGTVVTWTNTGAAPHTVTFEDGPDSGELAAGDTFEQSFDSPGRHNYACSIHPAMRGVLSVSP